MRAVVRGSGGENLKLTQPETVTLLASAILMLASWAARIRLFSHNSSDRQLKELLEDTFPTTFQDFLAFHLAFHWRRLTDESRRFSKPFLALYFLAAGLLILVVVSASLRHLISA